MAKITKTTQALLDARQGRDSLAIAGARQARLVTGTYYNHFARCYASRKPHADIGGILYFV